VNSSPRRTCRDRAIAAFVVGVTGLTQGSPRTAGRAGSLCVVPILITYLLVAG
jgi:hypothetical protein